MSLPGNGIFVVQGEMAMLVTSMRRSTRWGSHSFPNEEYDVLMRTFQDLKAILNQEDDLRNLDPATYLGPFLEVIRSKETTGPVTSLALSAINKFLSYGLIDPTHPSVPAIVDDIADAVTHARFVGTDHSSDGVVLMKILQVLRTLMLSPEGALLTDESVCEIMLSCFRICFETRLTELLRRNAEQCLRDMTQLIFMRLPQFPPEDASALTFSTVGLSLKKRDKSAKKKSLTGVNSTNSLERKSPILEQSSSSTGDNDAGSDATKGESALRHSQDKNLINEAEITIEPVEAKSPGKKHARHSSMDLAAGNPSITQLLEKCVSGTEEQIDTQTDAVLATDALEQGNEAEIKVDTGETDGTVCVKPSSPVGDGEGTEGAASRLEEYVNPRGIRFTPQDARAAPQPYGLVCVRELFRFLISLCNPLEGQNTSGMVHLGLSLVGTALELAADQLPARPALYRLVRDPLCRNLVTLLSTERISIFALDLQVSFLLFESLRFHLKFQMEAFFKKLIEIISADTTKAIYELKEIHHLTLESLAQMFRIPGLCTELYLNYDCDVYCMNVFEEITKLLSKNVASSTAYNIHELSLQTLMTILEAIEMGTQAEKLESKSETDVVLVEGESETKFGRGGHVSLELGGMDDASVVSDPVTHDISHYIGARTGRHKPSSSLPTEAELDNTRNMKKWVTQGTELFNQKPERGIEFLQEHGVLKTPLDPHEVAMFLRENPDLDKKMIGEYICKRSSRGEEDEGPSVLGAFAASFDYAGLRIDQALRLYLETFRLPGEAPLIFLVMERFAERWHTTNGEPFANTDAAFRLAYAVIMLNMDQHNHNAKKLNVPMTAEDFVRNLRGCNGNGDFDQAMLEEIYHSIKNEEMVMPAERVGPVRDAYLWRVLQRRGLTAGAVYRAAPPRHAHHARLFAVACPPIVTALSAAFERAQPPTAEELSSGGEGAALTAAAGLERVAALVARSGAAPRDAPTLDTLALTLAKFTGLLAAPHANYITVGVTLGQSTKAQLALRRVCAVAARHADYLRDSWRHLLEIVKTLYIGRLLPKCMVEAEDYLAPNGTVSLIREAARGTEAGLLSSLYSYIALGESGMRAPTPHEKSLIDIATECVTACNLPGLLVTETKFLQLESLQELVHAMVTVGTPPDSESLQLNPQLEDITIFFLELLGQTLIQNRDRSLSVWETASAHYRRVVFWAATRSAATLRRAVTALLRTGARLMRCHHCAAAVLQHLQVLMQLPYRLFYQQADVHLQVLMQLPYRLFYQQADVVSSLQRAVTALLRTGARLMRCHHCAAAVLQHLQVLMQLPYRLFYQQADVVSSLQRAVTALLRTGARLMRCHHCAAAVLQHLQVLMQLPYRLFYQQADVVTSLQRAVTALLRTGARLMRCHHCAAAVLQHLQVLMQLPYRLFYQQADVISYGLYEVVKTSAQNIHSAAEWRALLALLCAAGAGAWPDRPPAPADHYNTASSRSEGSDEDSEVRRPTSASSESELSHSPQQGWILVKNEPASSPPLSVEGEGGWWEGGGLRLRRHRAEALARCCEALALVVRDVAHVTPYNCRAAVHAVRLFARAALQHAKKSQDGKKQRSGSARRQNSDSSDEEIDTLDQYHLVSIQLLDLMHTLHSRTAQIFKWWHDEADQGQGAEEYDLWEVAWMPLLQGIAEFCTDRRKQVANSAIAYLQRALLVPGLSPGANAGAGGAGGAWEACFQRVLFPLLEQLPRRKHTAARANTIMCKVFLQHLSALSPRPSFPSLWARVIHVQAALVHAGPAADDALTEAALESLKNMVLVMDSVRIFSNGDTYNDLWYMTWEKIGEFLPNLKDELFPQAKESAPPNNTMPVATLVPAPNSTPSNVSSPHTLVSPSNPIQIQSPVGQPVAHSPVALTQSPPALCSAPTLVAPTPVAPGLVAPTPITPGLAAPTPIAPGMVPIRNPLYDQAGLTSSVLLQPLNEMISTPIGISIQSQMPILYPQTTAELLQTQSAPALPSQTELNSNPTESTLPQNLDIAPDKDIQQGELFAEYLTNPYHETKDLSTKEASLYDPESLIIDRIDNDKGEMRNPLLPVLDKQKSLSANATPMHTANKAQFGSTDNVRQEGSIFNFTSYFGSVNERNSEVFDTLTSTQEG